ncbi:MAG: hypothetical protein O7C75_03615 [Verrucomicrobia bacterium]|nr:hypothetical protein [Verrucomicrobiota bacterium]
MTIKLDGKEDTIFAVTDSEGNFKLEPVPGGEFFVHIDGRTATTSTYPDGAYYPFVGKSWISIPGRVDTLAGGTGVIHLPLIQADSLQAVSSTKDTEVTFTDEILQEFPELNGVTITVPANSLFSDDGSRGGSVGIAPVPPDRLPGQLPEMLQFPIVFTVQTDGASNFDTPAPVKFPNLPDPVTGKVLPPGAKTALWSFNHDSGRWEIQGSMTISEDGLFAVSDPGVGIRAPGWHGINPGSGGVGPKRPKRPKRPEDPEDPDRPDRTDDDDCTMEVICTQVVSEPIFALCLLKCMGNMYDRIFGDEEDKTPRSPLELGLCAGNALDCSQSNTMDDVLNSDKYDDSLSSKQTGCMDECLTPNTATFPAIVPCEGFVDPCPENLFSPEEISFLKENQVFYEIFALEDEIQSDWLAEQKALWAAEADYFSLILGTDKIAQTDPLELVILRAFFNAFRDRTEEGSEDGLALSPTERTDLLSLPRPSQFLEAEWTALIDRMELMRSNSLPAEQWDGAAIQVAAQHVLDVTQLLLDRGWRRHGDGMIYGMERLSIHLAPEVGSEQFPARDHFYLIHSFNSGFDLRGRLSVNGTLDGVIFAPDEYYMIAYLDPVTLNMGAATFFSSSAGIITSVPSAPLAPETADGDSDNDGLSNVVEKIVGTDASNSDTDADGVSDGAELQNGSNPLDGIPVAAGVVAAVETTAGASDIAVTGDIAALAIADEGVALVDVSNPLSPILLSEFDFFGLSVELLAAGGNNLLVSLNLGDIAIIDISDPTNPALKFPKLATSFRASTVAVYGGYGYAGYADSRLQKIDLRSGEIIWELPVDGFVQDVELSRGNIFVLTSEGLKIFEDTLVSPVLLGSVPINKTGSPFETGPKLFIDKDYVYVGHFFGYSVIDIKDPAQPVIVGEPPQTQLAVHNIVTNGSGLVLATTSFSGEDTLKLTVYDGSDPTVVDQTVADFDITGQPQGVAMHKGFALLADRLVGMQVVNFQGADFGNTPPEITLEAGFDLETGEVENGVFTWLYINATDDHQVRNVELYIDGELVAVEGAHPFEFSFIPPLITESKSSFTVQARASDMSGLLVFSDILNINIVDTTPPTLINRTPRDGSFQGADTVFKVSAFADEILDAALLSQNNFQLLEAGPDKLFDTADDIEISGTVGFNEITMELSHTPPAALDKGIYRATVAGVVDLSGNILAEALTWMFEVLTPNQWIAEIGGSWGVPENWSEGAVRQSDILVIDVPGDLVTTSITTGTFQIESISSEENFTLSGGTLNLNGEGVINGLFTWTGLSTIDGGGTLWANGGISISGTSNKFLNNLTLVNGDLGTWNEGSIIFQHEFSQLYNALGATLEITNESFQTIFGNDFLDEDSGLINDGAIIKKGPAEVSFSGLPFQNNGSLDIQEGEFTINNTKFHGKGSTTVRSDARFTFEASSTNLPSSPFLEGPIHLEENATLALEAAGLIGDEGVGITGNGNIEVLGGGQFNFGSTLEIQGDISAKNFTIRAGSITVLHGTTNVQTAILDGDGSELGGPGLFEIAGDLQWTRGIMSGGGITRLRGSVTMNQPLNQKIGDRTFEVYGDVVAEDGFLTFQRIMNGVIHIMPGGSWTQQNDFQFNGSSIGLDYWFFINEGTFNKEGDIGITVNRVNFENRGIMNLDFSAYRADYRFTQTAEGSFNVKIRDDPTVDKSFSSMAVGSTIELDGTLNIQLAENFVPDIGASYRILMGQTLNGTFATITGLEIAPDRKFEIVYNNKEAFLNVVALP